MTVGPGAEVVRVEGADALGYLQGQLSQDLAELPVPGSAWSLLLDPNGTVVAVAAVHVEAADAVTVEVPSGLGDAVRARLERFAIREDVAFRGPTLALDPVEPSLRDEPSRIDARIPGPVELATGLVAHGLDPALVSASVSFTKGCYPGQELVARMRARGATPPYVLVHATLDAPVEVGTPAGDASFEGQVTSVAEVGPSTWHALCVLHRRDAAGDEVLVRADTGELRAQLD